jgi:hypothetical protein
MEHISNLIKDQFENIKIKDKKSPHFHLQQYMNIDEYNVIKEELKGLIEFRYNLPASEINNNVIEVKKEIFLVEFVKKYITLKELKDLNSWIQENKNIKVNFKIDKSKFQTLYNVRQRYQSLDYRVQEQGNLEIVIQYVNDSGDTITGQSTQVYDPKKHYNLNGKMLKASRYEPEPETKYKNYSNYQDK